MEFLKTEREIEDKLAEADRHEGGESKATTPNQSDIDSQVDAKVLGQYFKFNMRCDRLDSLNKNSSSSPPSE